MLYELKAIGKKTRFFTDETLQYEVECTCGPQPINSTVRREVIDCPVHGEASNPQNWRKWK